MGNLLEELSKTKPERHRSTGHNGSCPKFVVDVFEAKRKGYKNSQIAEAAGCAYSHVSTATTMKNRAVLIFNEAKERGLLREMGFNVSAEEAEEFRD